MMAPGGVELDKPRLLCHGDELLEALSAEGDGDTLGVGGGSRFRLLGRLGLVWRDLGGFGILSGLLDLIGLGGLVSQLNLVIFGLVGLLGGLFGRGRMIGARFGKYEVLGTGSGLLLFENGLDEVGDGRDVLATLDGLVIFTVYPYGGLRVGDDSVFIAQISVGNAVELGPFYIVELLEGGIGGFVGDAGSGIELV